METYGLENIGIVNPKAVYRNLCPAKLIELALQRNEGSLTSTGALVVTTGKYTGRSPKDKFIVDTLAIHNEIAWGKVNKPISREKFNSLKNKITDYFKNREIFIFDGFAGADKNYTQKFRVINELASQNLFIHQLLKTGETAIFFGLSGTGKTTLSADPNRKLIGDDEHGWSPDGIFNFEGGCYAKCINLSQEHEPQIYNAIKFGAIVENVIINPKTCEPDYSDGSLTENTRAAYPVEYIENAQIPGLGGIPKVVIFLTADAFGVLPPISRLNKNAAMYHFVTGFTSKLAGTERGVTEPQPTFSTLFGEPFMPMDASVYARMLGEKLEKYGTKVYLVNTGWTGGSAASGAKRIKLSYTRAMVTAALNGMLDNVEYKHHDIFNVDYPTSCPGVPNENLDAKEMWADKKAYDEQANKLAQMFVKNFEEKYPNMMPEIVAAGPQPKN